MDPRYSFFPRAKVPEHIHVALLLVHAVCLAVNVARIYLTDVWTFFWFAAALKIERPQEADIQNQSDTRFMAEGRVQIRLSLDA